MDVGSQGRRAPRFVSTRPQLSGCRAPGLACAWEWQLPAPEGLSTAIWGPQQGAPKWAHPHSQDHTSPGTDLFRKSKPKREPVPWTECLCPPKIHVVKPYPPRRWPSGSGALGRN